MDFNWDRDALDAEIGACAWERGLVARADLRHEAQRFRGPVGLPAAEELWGRTLELSADAPWALTRRRWAFAVLEHDRLADARSSLARAWYEERHPVSEPDPGRYTPAELRAKALSDPPRRAAWLRAFAAACSEVAEQFARLWLGRLELGEDVGVDLLELDGATPLLFELAERWIERTDAMHRELRLDESLWLEVALARGAAEGWPGHLNWRSVAELLGGGAWLGASRLQLPEPPRALGASSYCRAFRAWGMAWADAHLARARPFMAWRDPTQLAERTRGSLLALLPLNGEFMRRRQGLSRLRVRDQRRHLARAVLLESRWAALRTMLRSYLRKGAPRGPKGYLPEQEEVCARVLGFALRGVAPGALPRLHASDPQDLGALFLASSRDAELVEQYDEDWFWNPRCCEVLRETFPSENAATPTVDFTLGSDALFRLLADALG